MKPFKLLSGIVAPLLIDDMNTDQVIPSAYLKDVHANLSEGLFAYLRRRPNGQRITSFVLEKDEFKNSKILLVGDNFGCGSSREHAVWALQEFGIHCLIGRGFAELFRENCLKNGVLTITLNEANYSKVSDYVHSVRSPQLTIDLLNCEIMHVGEKICDFTIDENERHMLLNGLDDIGLTLRDEEMISAWEKTIIKENAFFQTGISN